MYFINSKNKEQTTRAVLNTLALMYQCQRRRAIRQNLASAKRFPQYIHYEFT
jgi:hypothetical protein